MIRVSIWLLIAGLVPAPAQDISLEELLRRAREAQAQAKLPILEEVQAAIAQLEAPDLRDNTLRTIAHNLEKLGPAAGPLLVPALNPGDTVPAPYQTRSDRVLVVLESFEDLGTTLALLDVLKTGSPAHRLATLKALRTTQHRRIVAEALLPIIASPGEGVLSVPALATLSALAGEESCLWLQSCAERNDPNGELVALQALARAGNTQAGYAVLANLQRKGRSNADQYWVLRRTLEYFDSVPELLADGEDLRGPLMAAADGVEASERPGQPNETLASGRSLFLSTLLRIRDIKLGADIKRELWRWQELYTGGNRQVLALLAKGGDSKAKREYLDRLNNRVKAFRKAGGREFAGALLARGLALHLIGDSKAAQRDAERGLKELEDMNGGSGGDDYQGLCILAARSAAVEERFRSAADFLEKARLSSKLAAELAKDRDFATFVESKYGDILAP